MNNVEHPAHYNRIDLPECHVLIDGLLRGYSEFLSESQLFFLGNVIKYIYRAPDKNKLQDLEKARFYLDLLLEQDEHR